MTESQFVQLVLGNVVALDSLIPNLPLLQTTLETIDVVSKDKCTANVCVFGIPVCQVSISMTSEGAICRQI